MTSLKYCGLILILKRSSERTLLPTKQLFRGTRLLKLQLAFPPLTKRRRNIAELTILYVWTYSTQLTKETESLSINSCPRLRVIQCVTESIARLHETACPVVHLSWLYDCILVLPRLHLCCCLIIVFRRFLSKSRMLKAQI